MFSCPVDLLYCQKCYIMFSLSPMRLMLFIYNSFFLIWELSSAYISLFFFYFFTLSFSLYILCFVYIILLRFICSDGKLWIVFLDQINSLILLILQSAMAMAWSAIPVTVYILSCTFAGLFVQSRSRSLPSLVGFLSCCIKWKHSTPGRILPYSGMGERFHGDDPRFGDVSSDWVQILFFITISVTPSFYRKTVCLHHI